MFTKSLIQAINDWQRGGSSKQKQRRAAALTVEAAKLPAEFKQAPQKCFRQIALSGKSLMYLGTHFQLAESMSSWTVNETVAKDFKGGVPPPGDYIGAIFAITPNAASIVVNLPALFANADFLDAVESVKNSISFFGDGIGRWQNSQEEVVLELEQLPLDSVFAWGGFVSSEQHLAKQYFGKTPTAEQLQWFKVLMARRGHQPGAYWLSTTPASVERICEILKHRVNDIGQRSKS